MEEGSVLAFRERRGWKSQHTSRVQPGFWIQLTSVVHKCKQFLKIPSPFDFELRTSFLRSRSTFHCVLFKLLQEMEPTAMDGIIAERCAVLKGRKSAYEHITQCSDIKSKAVVFWSARALPAFQCADGGEGPKG